MPLHARALAIVLAGCSIGIVLCMLRITPPFSAVVGGAPPLQRVDAADAARYAQRCEWPTLEYRPLAMGAGWRRDLARLPYTPTVLSGRAHVVSAEVGHARKHYEIVADLPSRVLFPVLQFPGWTVERDGVVAAAQARPDDGRIVVELARGRHRVVLRFEGAPLVRIGGSVSLVAGFVLLVLAFVAWRTPTAS